MSQRCAYDARQDRSRCLTATTPGPPDQATRHVEIPARANSLCTKVGEVEDWAVAEVSAAEPLTVIDLRTTGLLKLGVTTNAARAKQQAAGRRLSKALYNHFAVDGVLYSSRLTSAECLAVYDRAVKPNVIFH